MKNRYIMIQDAFLKETLEVLNTELGVQEYHGKRVRSGDVLYTWRANFGEGIEADIKLCNGESPYIDAVLFEDGHEVHVLEPSDVLLGDYEFRHKGESYHVNVVPEFTKKQRARMVEEIEDSVDGWDLGTLVQFAKDMLKAEAEERNGLGLLYMWETNTGNELAELLEEDDE